MSYKEQARKETSMQQPSKPRHWYSTVLLVGGIGTGNREEATLILWIREHDWSVLNPTLHLPLLWLKPCSVVLLKNLTGTANTKSSLAEKSFLRGKHQKIKNKNNKNSQQTCRASPAENQMPKNPKYYSVRYFNNIRSWRTQKDYWMSSTKRSDPWVSKLYGTSSLWLLGTIQEHQLGFLACSKWEYS